MHAIVFTAYVLMLHYDPLGMHYHITKLDVNTVAFTV